MVETTQPIWLLWMRCPYDADLCGADAVLEDFRRLPDDSWAWTGRLVCPNGHEFHLSQFPKVIEEVDSD